MLIIDVFTIDTLNLKTLRHIITLFLFIFFSGTFLIYLSVKKKLETPTPKQETVEMRKDTTQLTFVKTV